MATYNPNDETAQFPCLFCSDSKGGTMRETLPGVYYCESCDSEVKDDESPVVPVVFAETEQSAEWMQFFVRDPQWISLPTQPLRHLFEDAWFNLVSGRYNASIVLMGSFVEAMVKEAISVHTGNWPTGRAGSLGRVIQKADDEGILRWDDRIFLRRFKDKVRNWWTHQDRVALTKGARVPVKKISFEGESPEERAEDLRDKLNQATDDAGGWEWKTADDHAFLANFLMLAAAERIAVPLYEELYDFTIRFTVRYLSDEDYADYHRRFSNSSEEGSEEE